MSLRRNHSCEVYHQSVCERRCAAGRTPTRAAQGIGLCYAANGKLELGEDPEEGSDGIERTETADGFTVEHADAEGIETNYEFETLAAGTTVRTTTNPDGTQSIIQELPDGTTTVTNPDGTVSGMVPFGDPRFGMQVPLGKTMSVTTPEGINATITADRTVTLSDPANPMSLLTQTDTLTVNGRTTTRTYNTTTRTLTETSPASRQKQTVLDTEGRPVQIQQGNLTATELGMTRRDASKRLRAERERAR